MATSRPTGNLLDIVTRQSKDIRRLKARLNQVGGGAGSSVPLGSVIPYAGSSAPDNFLICDGAAVSRTTYADLFDVVGETFGAGDGSTTFNLPDLREKFPVGANDVGGDYDLADTGGAEEVALAEAEMPSHAHTMGTHIHTMPTHSHTMPSHSHGSGSLSAGADGSHTHGLSLSYSGNSRFRIEFGGGSSASSGTIAVTSVTTTDNTRTTGARTILDGTQSAGSHGHAIGGNTSSVDPGDTNATDPGNTNAADPGDTNSAGSDQAHENRPPFVALNFIIRAL